MHSLDERSGWNSLNYENMIKRIDFYVVEFVCRQKTNVNVWTFCDFYLQITTMVSFLTDEKCEMSSNLCCRPWKHMRAHENNFTIVFRICWIHASDSSIRMCSITARRFSFENRKMQCFNVSCEMKHAKGITVVDIRTLFFLLKLEFPNKTLRERSEAVVATHLRT